MSDIAAHSGLGPFDPYWTDDAPRPRRDRRGWGRRVALGLAAGIGLVGVTALAPAPPSAPSPVSAPAVAPASSEIVDPTLAPLFTFETADGVHARYEARIDRATGARRDAYSLGALDGDAPALRVEMWKSASARGAGSLFVEIAEETAAFGAAVERLGISQIVTTSQGPVEWADLTLAGARGKRTCVGFRLLGSRGWRAARRRLRRGGRENRRGALSCLVDRLALTRAGREAGFADIVKSAAIRRPTCRAAIG